MALVEAPHAPLRDVRLDGGLLGLVRVLASFRVLAAMALAITYFQTWHAVRETEVDRAKVAEIAQAAHSAAELGHGSVDDGPAVDSAPDLPPPRRETGKVTTCTGFGHHGHSVIPPLLAALIFAGAASLFLRPTLSKGMISAASTVLLAFAIFRATFDPVGHADAIVQPQAAQALFGMAFVILALTAVADLGFHPILYMWARREQAPPRS